MEYCVLNLFVHFIIVGYERVDYSQVRASQTQPEHDNQVAPPVPPRPDGFTVELGQISDPLAPNSSAPEMISSPSPYVSTPVKDTSEKSDLYCMNITHTDSDGYEIPESTPMERAT